MQTTYSTDPGRAIPGMIDGTVPRTVETAVNGEAAAAIPFGVAVMPDGANERSAKLFAGVAAVLLGVALHEHLQATGSTGSSGHPIDRPFPVMRKGRAWMVAEGALPIGSAVFVRHTANGDGKSQLGAFRADDDDGNARRVYGARVVEAAADGLALIEFDAAIDAAVGASGPHEVSDFGLALVADETAAEARATLGLGNLATESAVGVGLELLDDETAAEARATLELGDAATLDVGAVAGTVCAGDDARLSDARTPADGSVTLAKLVAGPAGSFGVPFMCHFPFAAGAIEGADVVVINDANFPCKARLVDVVALILAGADEGRKVWVQRQGIALTGEISAASVGRAEEFAVFQARPVVAAGDELSLYRSHDAVAGELLLTFIPEA